MKNVYEKIKEPQTSEINSKHFQSAAIDDLLNVAKINVYDQIRFVETKNDYFVKIISKTLKNDPNTFLAIKSIIHTFEENFTKGLCINKRINSQQKLNNASKLYDEVCQAKLVKFHSSEKVEFFSNKKLKKKVERLEEKRLEKRAQKFIGNIKQKSQNPEILKKKKKLEYEQKLKAKESKEKKLKILMEEEKKKSYYEGLKVRKERLTSSKQKRELEFKMRQEEYKKIKK